MTLPLSYAITDGDKNCIGVVCPPFMSSACHLSCPVRLNMGINSRRHERLMQRSPSGRTVQAVLQTTLVMFCVLLYCSKAVCGAFAVLRCQLSRFWHDTVCLMFELLTHARLDGRLLATTVPAVLQTTLLRSCVLLHCSKALCVVFAVREVPVIEFFGVARCVTCSNSLLMRRWCYSAVFLPAVSECGRECTITAFGTLAR